MGRLEGCDEPASGFCILKVHCNGHSRLVLVAAALLQNVGLPLDHCLNNICHALCTRLDRLVRYRFAVSNDIIECMASAPILITHLLAGRVERVLSVGATGPQ